MKKFLSFIFTVSAFLPFAQTKVGINTTTPSDPLDVNGSANFRGVIKVNSSAGTANQVLMSKGPSVNPVWANTAYTGGGRFWIIPTNNSRSTGSVSGRGGWTIDGAAQETSQTDSLDFGTTNETGTDFTINNPGLVNNYITVNKTGLYHIEGVLRYFVTGSLSVTMLPRVTLNFIANQPTSPDLNLILAEDPMDKTGGSETGNSTNTYNSTLKFSFNIHLETGTTFTLNTGFNLLRFPSNTDLIAMGVSSGGYVSGQFVAE